MKKQASVVNKTKEKTWDFYILTQCQAMTIVRIFRIDKISKAVLASHPLVCGSFYSSIQCLLKHRFLVLYCYKYIHSVFETYWPLRYSLSVSVHFFVCDGAPMHCWSIIINCNTGKTMAQINIISQDHMKASLKEGVH